MALKASRLKTCRRSKPSPLNVHGLQPEQPRRKAGLFGFLGLERREKSKDRKSTRLNSSHEGTSYADFRVNKIYRRSCPKKPKNQKRTRLNSSHDWRTYVMYIL